MAGTSYQRSFRILQSEEGSTSFNSDNSANFPGEQKYNEEFWGFYFLTIREKIRSRSRPQRILKSLYLSITIQRWLHDLFWQICGFNNYLMLKRIAIALELFTNMENKL